MFELAQANTIPLEKQLRWSSETMIDLLRSLGDRRPMIELKTNE